jgi:hypothetical protein
MDLWEKLQIKPESTVAVVNAPSEGPSIAGPFTVLDEPGTADVTIVFVKDRSEIDSAAGPAVEAALADRLAWFAYPKAKKLGTDLNRDLLAQELIARGIDPVRQVSLDDVWSALRFRPAFRSAQEGPKR